MKKRPGVRPRNPRRLVMDLRLGIGRYLTFAQGIDNAQQPPQAVGSAAVALPGGHIAGNRRRVVGAKSIGAEYLQRQVISFR